MLLHHVQAHNLTDILYVIPLFLFRAEGSKVLVHCKMGVSRSASVVIAYAMKAYNWDFKKALDYVQQKRNCIKPNSSFISQLETYQV